MAQPHIIRRTEKIKHLKELLKEKRNVYLASSLYSGKTELLTQLAKSLPGKVLQWDAETGDWAEFERKARAKPECTLLIDSLDRLPSADTADALAMLLAHLPSGQNAVLAGRERMPAYLRNLCVNGTVLPLPADFLYFTEEEINQFFLDYGISLTPDSIAAILKNDFGWPPLLHSLARMMLESPNTPLTSFFDRLRRDDSILFIQDVIMPMPEQDRTLLYNLAPFPRFSADLARMLCGRSDAPRLLSEIVSRFFFISMEGLDEFYFSPPAQRALFEHVKNLFDQEYINCQYRRAALYYQLNNQPALAVRLYVMLNDTTKIKELLIRETYVRPSNSDLVEFRTAYDRLPEKMILSSPELMRGKSMLESLLGRPSESERWYQELVKFFHIIPARDSRHQTAYEAIHYLDIALPHRGSRNLLRMFISFTQMKSLLESRSWRAGFNVAGNNVSLINGGKDFSRWLPHRSLLFQWVRIPVEKALGANGNGVGELAFAEGEYQCGLTGDYSIAMDHACKGLAQVSNDTEMESVAIGIQSGILAAQGNIQDAIALIRHLEQSLPADAPIRLRQNLAVHRLYCLLLTGKTDDAMEWLQTEAPDETEAFIILDRFRFMLKLRLYILSGQWKKIPFLAATLRQYFEGYDRPYMLVQLHLLQAIVCRRTGKGSWQEEMEAALALARRYQMARVIADEGIGIVDMLNEMNLPDDDWAQGVLNLTRAQAVNYPTFMNQVVEKPVFTEREYQVYSLMISGCKNAKIASILNITERTVKHYTGEIYRKLGVTTRSEAISRASEWGGFR